MNTKTKLEILTSLNAALDPNTTPKERIEAVLTVKQAVMNSGDESAEMALLNQRIKKLEDSAVTAKNWARHMIDTAKKGDWSNSGLEFGCSSIEAILEKGLEK
jgi:hypothetical protein